MTTAKVPKCNKTKLCRNRIVYVLWRRRRNKNKESAATPPDNWFDINGNPIEDVDGNPIEVIS